MYITETEHVSFIYVERSLYNDLKQLNFGVLVELFASISKGWAATSEKKLFRIAAL